MLGAEDTVMGRIHTPLVLRQLTLQAKETDRYMYNAKPYDKCSMVGENEEWRHVLVGN